MWPFSKRTKKVSLSNLYYSQLDITEKFGDNLNLKPEEWIKTFPLNLIDKNPELSGLPPVNSTIEKVYETAQKLSAIREQINMPTDGVYCPVCHIANIELSKLRKPCSKCGRELLRFGWD